MIVRSPAVLKPSFSEAFMTVNFSGHRSGFTSMAQLWEQFYAHLKIKRRSEATPESAAWSEGGSVMSPVSGARRVGGILTFHA